MTKQQLLAGSGVLAFVAVIFGLGAALMYQVRYVHSEAPFIVSAANVFGMDVAKVDGKAVSYNEYLSHVRAQRTFLNSPTAIQNGSTGAFGKAEEQQSFDRVLRVAAVDALARENALEVTSKDIDSAFDQLLAEASTTTDAGEVDMFLREQFGWSTDEFKNYMLRPAIIEQTLTAKYAEKANDPNAFNAALQDVLDKKTVRYLKF